MSPREMVAKRKSPCTKCGKMIYPGNKIRYAKGNTPEESTIEHLVCPGVAQGPSEPVGGPVTPAKPGPGKVTVLPGGDLGHPSYEQELRDELLKIVAAKFTSQNGVSSWAVAVNAHVDELMKERANRIQERKEKAAVK